MTIKERHELQQDIAISHVLVHRNKRPDLRKLMAHWMREARRLNDVELQRIAATL